MPLIFPFLPTAFHKFPQSATRGPATHVFLVLKSVNKLLEQKA